MRREFLKTLGAAAALPWLPRAALAQAWKPTQPVRVIVPFPAGGTSDLVVRILAERATERFGQPFVVDNRGGAATQIGTSAVVTSKPDGHTLLLVSNTIAVNPSLFSKLPYDTLADLEPITYAGVTAQVLVVNSSLPVHNLKELIAYAKANPAKLTYGSAGNGTSLHLGMEEIKKRTGIFMVHVPYRGLGPMMSDLLGNAVQLGMVNVPNVVPLLESGKLRVIGVGYPTRVSQFPDVPTIAEQGLAGYESNSTFMFFAPKGTPTEVLDRLNAGIVGILKEPGVSNALQERGILVQGTSRAEAASFMRREIAKYAELVKFSGAKID